eukprot:267877_1
MDYFNKEDSKDQGKTTLFLPLAEASNSKSVYPAVFVASSEEKIKNERHEFINAVQMFIGTLPICRTSLIVLLKLVQPGMTVEADVPTLEAGWTEFFASLHWDKDLERGIHDDTLVNRTGVFYKDCMENIQPGWDANRDKRHDKKERKVGNPEGVNSTRQSHQAPQAATRAQAP